jgi:tetratricopeptide (TPR) repeat protein
MSEPLDDLRNRIARARGAQDSAAEFTHTAALARLLIQANCPADAAHAADRLATLAAEFDDPQRHAAALVEIGSVWLLAGEHARALAAFTRALDEHRALAEPAPGGEVRALAGIGRVKVAQGDLQAASYYEEALALTRRHTLYAHQAQVLNGLGVACMLEGRADWAAQCFREAIVICRDLEDSLGTLQNLDGLAVALLDQGDGEAATPAIEEALSLTRSRLERPREAQLLLSLGSAHGLSGRPDLAVIAYQEAAALAHDLRQSEVEAEANAGVYFCRKLLK